LLSGLRVETSLAEVLLTGVRVAGFLPAGFLPGVFLALVAFFATVFLAAALAAGRPLVAVFFLIIFSPLYFDLSGNISSRCTIHNA
jgi:hypothetical protein